MLARGKQFLLLIRHPPCYSFVKSSPVKKSTVIEERKNLHTITIMSRLLIVIVYISTGSL